MRNYVSHKRTSGNAGDTPLHALFQYQKEKTATFVRWLTISSALLCLSGVGLGLLWHFKSSWVALFFAVIFAAFGLALAAIIFIINEKLELFNNVASSALNMYDMAQKKSTIIDMENDATPESKTPEVITHHSSDFSDKKNGNSSL